MNKLCTIHITIVLFLLSCGKNTEQLDTTVRTADQTELLRAKYDIYLEGLQKQQDEHGFILSDKCDSLLFTGLVGAVLPIQVDIEAAREVDGSWKRRPVAQPCYPQFSESSISRDMLVGLLWYAWRNKRLDIADQLLQYGKENGWIMGAGPYSRTYVTPGLQSTIAEVVYRLGGEDNKFLRSYPQVWGSADGYQRHLQILLILLRGELTGSIGDWALETVQEAFASNSSNALFAYAHAKWSSGDYAPMHTALLDTDYFPDDRLPDTSNYCTEWLWERAPGPDWKPCPGAAAQHTGADWLFVYGLLNRR